MSLLSQHFSVLQSSDLDQTRQLVGTVFNDHDLRRHQATEALDYTHHYANYGALGFSVLSYGASVGIRTKELNDFYLLQIPLRGRDVQFHQGNEASSQVGDISVHAPSDQLEMNWSADCQKLAIRIDRQRLESYAAHMHTDGVAQPLCFSSKLNGHQGAGLALRLAAGHVFRSIWKQPEVFRLPMIWSQFEQLLLANVLAAQSAPDVTLNKSSLPSPKSVKRAEDYMRANLQSRLTLEALAREVGVSMRALHDGFKQFRGESPMRYLKNLRLERTRDDLMAPRGKQTVTAIAQQWGFHEMGRFANAYKARFGELPSETLKRHN